MVVPNGKSPTQISKFHILFNLKFSLPHEGGLRRVLILIYFFGNYIGVTKNKILSIVKMRLCYINKNIYRHYTKYQIVQLGEKYNECKQYQ